MPTGKEWFYVVNSFPHAKISVKMNDDHFDGNFGMREGILLPTGKEWIYVCSKFLPARQNFVKLTI